MHRLITPIAALIPAIAVAQTPSPCAFTLGYGSIGGESSAETQKMLPYWFTVSGRAVVDIRETKLVAKLYDATAKGEQTHTFTASLGNAPGKATSLTTTVTGALKNLASDTGPDALSGTLGIVLDPHGPGKPVLHSLVAHSAYTFVAISCYGKSAA